MIFRQNQQQTARVAIAKRHRNPSVVVHFLKIKDKKKRERKKERKATIAEERIIRICLRLPRERAIRLRHQRRQSPVATLSQSHDDDDAAAATQLFFLLFHIFCFLFCFVLFFFCFVFLLRMIYSSISLSKGHL